MILIQIFQDRLDINIVGIPEIILSFPDRVGMLVRTSTSHSTKMKAVFG